MSDAAAQRLAGVLEAFEAECADPDLRPWYRDMAQAFLDALPALLREDSPAGDALRERLGLTRETRANPAPWDYAEDQRFLTRWEAQS